MNEVITTGTDVIRQMLRVRNKKMNLASLARDVGISSDTLLAFTDGKRSLPIPVLQGLTKVFWNEYAVYDPEVDRLRPARREPAKPQGVMPSLTIPLPTYTAGPAQTALRPVNVEITEPPPSGTDAIREALRVRRKTNLATLASDHGLSAASRDAFIDGRRSLPAETLRAIAKDLWPHLEFDAQADRLRPAVREPAKSLGVLPRLDPKLLPKYKPGACETAHRPVNDSPPTPKPKQRPGWLGGW
jgi:DNA-binding phage protein